MCNRFAIKPPPVPDYEMRMKYDLVGGRSGPRLCVRVEFS